MRKKLFFLLLALATAVGASLSASRVEALPRECVTTCCDNSPNHCMTCCPWTHCSDLAC